MDDKDKKIQKLESDFVKLRHVLSQLTTNFQKLQQRAIRADERMRRLQNTLDREQRNTR